MSEAPATCDSQGLGVSNYRGTTDMTTISILEAVNTTSVQFHGQPIITAMVAGVAYIAMRPIVENIGIDWAGQTVKLRNQKDKFNCCDIAMVASDKKVRDFLCIPLRKLNGWLFSINPAKVRADIRDKLIAYQEECFTVLHDYWTKGVVVRKPETTVDDRTPLRGIVNRIMGKYGMTYQAVYKIVHKEFGVKHIDELSPKQTSEAIEYLAGKVIDGEFIGKGSQIPMLSQQFSDKELYDIVCLWAISKIIKDDAVIIKKALELIESPLSSRISSCAHEVDYFMDRARKLLMRETQHIAEMPNPGLGWMTELKRLRADS